MMANQMTQSTLLQRRELTRIVNREIKKREQAEKAKRLQVMREAKKTEKELLQKTHQKWDKEYQSVREMYDNGALLPKKTVRGIKYLPPSEVSKQIKAKLKQVRKQEKAAIKEQKKKTREQYKLFGKLQKEYQLVQKRRSPLERYIALQKAGLFSEEEDRKEMRAAAHLYDKTIGLADAHIMNLWQKVDAAVGDKKYNETQQQFISVFDITHAVSADEMEHGLYVGPDSEPVQRYQPITAENAAKTRHPVDFAEKNIRITPTPEKKTEAPAVKTDKQKEKDEQQL